MDDNFGCTNGVGSEEMIWFDSGKGCESSNNEVKEEHSECCWSERGVGKHGELEGKGRGKRGTKRARTSSEIEYHIISERKRRQDIAEKFIELSATIPGLKKVCIYLCIMYVIQSSYIHGVYLLLLVMAQTLICVFIF